MLAILPWWGIPVAAVVLATIVLGGIRRLRRPRDNFETLHHYQRFRDTMRRDQSGRR
jgi:cytochrome c-type biogenesis protein CcmH/NrfF